ncbi:MAG: hypothetical protein JNL79_23855 [Myxococcales bacterium]|nr:hypothetical protein [Myxococcales bacterium]
MKRAVWLFVLLGCRNTPTATTTEVPPPPPLPEPAAVCTKAVDLTFADMDAKPTAAERDAFRTECLKEAEKEQAEEPTVYACEAPCVMAAKVYAELESCTQKCKPHD